MPFFFFNHPATTEIYTLSLHDALPILCANFGVVLGGIGVEIIDVELLQQETERLDRKSTRLNSSHPSISYAVFCLKKKTTERSASASKIVVSSRLCSRASHALTVPLTP